MLRNQKRAGIQDEDAQQVALPEQVVRAQYPPNMPDADDDDIEGRATVVDRLFPGVASSSTAPSGPAKASSAARPAVTLVGPNRPGD